MNFAQKFLEKKVKKKSKAWITSEIIFKNKSKEKQKGQFKK